MLRSFLNYSVLINSLPAKNFFTLLSISLSSILSPSAKYFFLVQVYHFQAEGLGMGAELAAGDNQNLNDSEFTCSLFRFLQLTCEGHNLGDAAV